MLGDMPPRALNADVQTQILMNAKVDVVIAFSVVNVTASAGRLAVQKGWKPQWLIAYVNCAPELVMLGGDQNAISGHLKKAIGSRNIKLAAPDVVLETTGYAVGSIPPFHWQPDGFRTFLDAALMNEPELGVGAGVWGYEIIITPQHLVEATAAIVVNLTEP